MRNVSHRLQVFESLFMVGNVVCEGLRGMALPEEAGHGSGVGVG